MQTIHLLRLLSYSFQASVVTALQLKKELQKFVEDHSLNPMNEKAESEELSDIGRMELEMKYQKIKKNLIMISKTICSKSTPFINTRFYDRDINHDTTLLFLSFNDYIYKIEKCTIYVSFMNII